MTKGMAEFVLFESFAEILGARRFKNFDEALFGNVSEGDLTAIIEATCDYAPVV